ncbi:transmembrane prediction [Rhodopirellula sp. SM50]|nr:transmembrane prediction [Rhodopirellula sp. SM50]
MIRQRSKTFVMLTAMLVVGAAGIALAQWGRRFRSIEEDRRGVPQWEVDRQFPGDTFTFARVYYDSYYGRGRGGGGWRTDYPDSDLNFSLRLQQLTTIKVNPDPVIVNLTDENLSDYPFLYMIEPGGLVFSEAEVVALRKYCFNGGFLMVDDFWGDTQYENLAFELERVFPDRKPFEVPLDHEIFHNVYDMKEKPQVPAIGRAWGSVTWEDTRDGSDNSVPHYRAIVDDKDRIMVFICHNTDLGDGWEREGEDEEYFREFSVKKAYPMGINIVTYAMTH